MTVFYSLANFHVVELAGGHCLHPGTGVWHRPSQGRPTQHIARISTGKKCAADPLALQDCQAEFAQASAPQNETIRNTTGIGELLHQSACDTSVSALERKGFVDHDLR